MEENFKMIQKEEAIKRMKMVDLYEPAIEAFVEDDKLNKSEGPGALYWLNDEEKEIIRKWEEETGNLAYHLVLSYTKFGKLLSVFYVSKHKREWEMDRQTLEEGLTVAYVMNLDYDYLSELGYIGFESRNGGVVRVS